MNLRLERCNIRGFDFSDIIPHSVTVCKGFCVWFLPHRDSQLEQRIELVRGCWLSGWLAPALLRSIMLSAHGRENQASSREKQKEKRKENRVFTLYSGELAYDECVIPIMIENQRIVKQFIRIETKRVDLPCDRASGTKEERKRERERWYHYRFGSVIFEVHVC